MTEDLAQYERTIKRVHSFMWEPRYEETFRNDKVLKYILPRAVIVTCLSSIFFEYKIVTDRFELHDVGFIDYIKIKTRARYTIDKSCYLLLAGISYQRSGEKIRSDTFVHR